MSSQRTDKQMLTNDMKINYKKGLKNMKTTFQKTIEKMIYEIEKKRLLNRLKKTY